MTRNRLGLEAIVASYVLLLVTSCASLSGAWYYQSDGDDARKGTALYLALVNRTKDPANVKEIWINGGGTDFVGWHCRGETRGPLVARGELVVIPLETGDTCAVPVSAEITMESGHRVSVDLSGSMPTALPPDWQKCPSVVTPPSVADEVAAAKAKSSGQPLMDNPRDMTPDGTCQWKCRPWNSRARAARGDNSAAKTPPRCW